MPKYCYRLAGVFPLCSFLSVPCLASDCIIFSKRSINRERLHLGYEIKVSYPQAKAGSGEEYSVLNKAIRYQILRRYRRFIKYYNDPKNRNQPVNRINAALYIGYEITLNRGGLVSIQFTESGYGGGAHPVQETFAVNYDLNDDREIAMRDIFKVGSNYRGVINWICNQHFRGRMFGKDKIKKVDSWNLRKAGIEVRFNHCILFPCSEGVPTLLISFNEIKKMLKDESPISKYSQWAPNPRCNPDFVQTDRITSELN